MNLIRGQVLRVSTEAIEPSHTSLPATLTMSSAPATSSSLLAFSRLTNKKRKASKTPPHESEPRGPISTVKRRNPKDKGKEKA